MRTKDLAEHDFLLGVEERWDSYYEAPAKFVRRVTISRHSFYIFEHLSTGKTFALRPRYKGQHIEDVLSTKQIFVNAFEVDASLGHPRGERPKLYATGVLQLIGGP